MATQKATEALKNVHPQMLRDQRTVDPQRLGDDHKRECGQALEWALDRAGITKQQAAYAMGYSDQNVVTRWISGVENMQIPKLRLLGDAFFYEFVVALAQTCAGIKTVGQTLLQKVG